MQILDISWNRKGKSEDFIQELTVFDSEIRRIPLAGFMWQFELSEKRFCPGYFDENGTYIPCPSNSVLTKRAYDKCFYCSGKDGWKAAFLFGDEPNEKMKKYLAKAHHLYLAFFQPDKIKIGTSSRNTERLIEQDALVYAFIGEEIGSDVQIIEKAISKTFDEITETVQSRSKLKFIHTKPDVSAASKAIESAFRKIKSRFVDAEFKDKLFEKISVGNFMDEDELYFPKAIPTLVKDPNQVVGNHKGIRGKYIIFQKDDKEYVINSKDIIGKKIINTIDLDSYFHSANDPLDPKSSKL